MGLPIDKAALIETMLGNETENVQYTFVWNYQFCIITSLPLSFLV